MGTDVKGAKRADAGKILADTVRKYMRVMKVENGLTELGFEKEDIPTLVQGTLPQVNVKENKKKIKRIAWKCFESMRDLLVTILVWQHI